MTGETEVGRAVRAFRIGPGEAGERFDAALSRLTGLSRATAARLIDAGDATVDGSRAARSARLAEGSAVSVVMPEERVSSAPEAEDVAVRVLYEDEHLLVVSKPAGLVVHPSPGHAGGTLVNALLARAGKPVGGAGERPGIVHRLDAGTSGLLVVAKTEQAYVRLVEMMASHEAERVYVALVEGIPAADTGTIDAPIGRSPKHRKRMAVVPGGRDAVTDFEVIRRFDATSLLEVRPRTGRTHQIRVHLAAAGHPVVGDTVYGRRRADARTLGLERPFLHAARLGFDHPVTGRRVEIEDGLPDDLERALRALG